MCPIKFISVNPFNPRHLRSIFYKGKQKQYKPKHQPLPKTISINKFFNKILSHL